MSFKSLEKWKENFISHANPEHLDSYPFILVGNKTDLEDERCIPSTKAEEWVRQNGILNYYECSAKENNNVEETHQVKVQEMFEGTCEEVL
jgi:GTPase SAR1 family protein